MCLILFSYKSHPDYPLILAANRDEFFKRPTASADFWHDVPELLGGRDLRHGGTWLGITKKGRIAAVTDYRDPFTQKKDAPSRGLLVSGFLKGKEKPFEYLQRISKEAHRYNGFSLVLGNVSSLYYYSNRNNKIEGLSQGIYGLSNHLLDTPWPKVKKGKEAFRKILSQNKNPSPEALFEILADTKRPEDTLLPDTGVGLERERVLSSIFISTPDYGTRSSTILFIDKENHVTFIERVFHPESKQIKTERHEFKIDSINSF